jgi:hypothetical protein
MKRLRHIVLLLTLASWGNAGNPAEARGHGAFDDWLIEAGGTCDWFNTSDPMTNEYFAQCDCSTEPCNDYVSNWCDQARDACADYCDTYYCGIQEQETFCTGGNYEGYITCSCYPARCSRAASTPGT